MSEDDAKKLVDLNSQTVANVIFTQRKGKRGYDERQVDYYLNECVQLLTRLESYARVADFVGEPPKARWPQPIRPQPVWHPKRRRWSRRYSPFQPFPQNLLRSPLRFKTALTPSTL